ncbi:MAG: YkgJ family cysteine cluster protein [Bacteroidetes bacterium]|nr:YkgJ family cysteine cluster protein [Bacteroidota bacterium]
MKTTPFFNQYFALIEKLNTRIEELQNSQTEHIVCKKGCAACCMNFGILPIEYYAISQAIKNTSKNLCPRLSKKSVIPAKAGISYLLRGDWLRRAKGSCLRRNDGTIETSCKFLHNNTCAIYMHRPIICRTQGLANVYFNEETDAWELSLCEQNFTTVSDDFFTEEQCLNMDEINETLAEINRSFLEANKTELSQSKALIDVNEL